MAAVQVSRTFHTSVRRLPRKRLRRRHGATPWFATLRRRVRRNFRTQRFAQSAWARKVLAIRTHFQPGNSGPAARAKQNKKCAFRASKFLQGRNAWVRTFTCRICLRGAAALGFPNARTIGATVSRQRVGSEELPLRSGVLNSPKGWGSEKTPCGSSCRKSPLSGRNVPKAHS